LNALKEKGYSLKNDASNYFDYSDERYSMSYLYILYNEDQQSANEIDMEDRIIDKKWKNHEMLMTLMENLLDSADKMEHECKISITKL